MRLALLPQQVMTGLPGCYGSGPTEVQLRPKLRTQNTKSGILFRSRNSWQHGPTETVREIDTCPRALLPRLCCCCCSSHPHCSLAGGPQAGEAMMRSCLQPGIAGPTNACCQPRQRPHVLSSSPPRPPRCLPMLSVSGTLSAPH